MNKGLAAFFFLILYDNNQWNIFSFFFFPFHINPNVWCVMHGHIKIFNNNIEIEEI